MQIDLPLTVQVGRKNYALNLNVYRNAHHIILNKMKVNFTSQLQEKLVDLPRFKHVDLVYTLYPKTKRLCDTMNVGSIVDKFFCDALVHYGKIEDDNYTIARDFHFKFGEVDPKNPRVTVTIQGDIYEDYDCSDGNRGSDPSVPQRNGPSS